MKKKKGFSLVEILIVISIFSVIGILSTRIILLTMRGAKKSDSQVRVRENVNYALSIIERQIRNSEVVNCASSTSSQIIYTSLEGVASTFSCVSGSDSYILSGTSRLTSSDISITSCLFSCTQTNENDPPVVKVKIVAEDKNNTSVENGSVTVETEIVTRNY